MPRRGTSVAAALRSASTTCTRRRAAGVGRAAPGARRGRRAGVRLLQQQRYEPRRARRQDGAGRGKRKGAAAAPAGRERPGERRREDLMDVLSIVHGEQVRAGVFGDAVEARGHRIDEWSVAWRTSPPRPVEDYGAVLVFGGAMHADQEDEHPWLQEEGLLLQRLVAAQTPLLGICLGAQLLAKASGAHVGPAREPEIGW